MRDRLSDAGEAVEPRVFLSPKTLGSIHGHLIFKFGSLLFLIFC